MDAALRELVRRRAGQRCEYCRLPQAQAPIVRFHVEHVVPRQHGGSDESSNLALACPRCNSFKGPNLTAIDPESGQVVPLFHPRTDSWEDHFDWHGVILIGRTPNARATVRLLNMNAEERIQVRRELRQRGEI